MGKLEETISKSPKIGRYGDWNAENNDPDKPQFGKMKHLAKLELPKSQASTGEPQIHVSGLFIQAKLQFFIFLPLTSTLKAFTRSIQKSLRVTSAFLLL